jgi:hypothetical protein
MRTVLFMEFGKQEIRMDHDGSNHKWVFYDTTMVDTCIVHSPKLIECATPRMNPNVNYGHWVMMDTLSYHKK